MTKEIVAFQGEKGAYSHLACEEIFPQATIKTCATFEETFKMDKKTFVFTKLFIEKI